MVRTLGYVTMLLAAGIAQSAPPAEIVSVPATTLKGARYRFLSLAEARAIALEQGTLDEKPALAVFARRKPEPRGILLITHIPNRAEFERNVNQMLLNIENAYWNLYGSYWQLYSREQGLRFAYETWKIVGASYRDGKASLACFAQAEDQYNLFRSQRLQAVDAVLDNECQLRAMMGMKIEDGRRLVPSDAPTQVEKKPDWDKALAEALKHRPELRIAREVESEAGFGLWWYKNSRGQELGFFGVKDCDTAHNESAASTMLWMMPETVAGFSPLLDGLRQAQLRLAQTRHVLQDQELKAERFLGLYYRRISSSYAQIKAAHAQREAFATQLRVRSESYRAEAKDANLDLMLEAQRFWADSLATEYQAIVCYNNSLAGWEYAKGAILDYAHVTLAEEPPVGCEKVRAVVYERRRTREQMQRESAAPTNSLPGLWKNVPPLRDADELPPVEKDSSRKTGGADPKLIEWKWQADIVPHVRRWVEQTP